VFGQWLELLIGVSFLVAGEPPQPLPGVEVERVNRSRIVGQWLGLEEDAIVLRAESAEECRVPLEEVVRIRFFPLASGPTSPVAAGAVWINLTDGSRIVARALDPGGSKEEVVLRGLVGSWDLLKVPLASIAAIQFRELSPRQSAQWQALLEQVSEADRVVVAQGDNLDYYPGVVEGVSSRGILFAIEGERLELGREKIVGVVLYRASGAGGSRGIGRIVDRFGCRWVASSLEMHQGKLRWKTPYGLVVDQPPEDLIEIDFAAERVVYLGQLPAEVLEVTPGLSVGELDRILAEFYRPQVDRGFGGEPLKLGGTTYKHGVAMRSRTRVVYQLPAGAQRFQAWVGIDDRCRPGGQVKLSIRTEHGNLWEGVISGSEPEQFLDLQLGGASRLEIFVDFAGSQILGGHINFCEARVIR